MSDTVAPEEVQELNEADVILAQPQNTYELFETDPDLEQDGCWFNFGNGRVKLSYIDNVDYQAYISEQMRPYAEAHARGLLRDSDVVHKITARGFAKFIIKGWEGVTNREGEPLEFNEENAYQILLDLKHMLRLCRDLASNFANYRMIYAERSAKKSLSG